MRRTRLLSAHARQKFLYSGPGRSASGCDASGWGRILSARSVSGASGCAGIVPLGAGRGRIAPPGLGLGADDYITKPFLPQELLLACVLPAAFTGRKSPSAQLGETEIDWGKGTVRRNGKETAPSRPKNLPLLRKLWEARGNIVTIDALCSALWDGPLVGYENTLMVHIRRLREKVEEDPSHPRYLLTVRGLGYRLKREKLP